MTDDLDLTLRHFGRRLEELEQRETILVLYTFHFRRGWQVEDIDDLRITDRTWPRYFDSGDSQSGPEPDMCLSTAMVWPYDHDDGRTFWAARCRTVSGGDIAVQRHASRKETIAALVQLINETEQHLANH